jgi:phthalate 3,4-dioxygenase beta subunit
MTVTRNDVDLETYFRLHQFCMHETKLLDQHRLHDWLDLLAPEFMYRIPIPVTRDNPALAPYAADAFLVEESRDSIANLWVRRFEPEFFEYAWGENPPQRTRRFVTNLAFEVAEGNDAYVATSNVLLSFARQSDPVVLVPAGRVDRIEAGDGDYRLASRTVYIDQTVQTLTHMRILF